MLTNSIDRQYQLGPALPQKTTHQVSGKKEFGGVGLLDGVVVVVVVVVVKLARSKTRCRSQSLEIALL